MEGSTYKHRYFYFYLIDKDLQHCLISKSKTTHAIHDEFHEPHYRDMWAPEVKAPIPVQIYGIKKQPLLPRTSCPTQKVLDVSPTQSINLLSGYPPQNRNVLKRQAPPGGTNTTLATSDTASASQLVASRPALILALNH